MNTDAEILKKLLANNSTTHYKHHTWAFLFSTILCVVEFASHNVISQDSQGQAIPGQDTKEELSHSSMDSNKN